MGLILLNSLINDIFSLLTAIFSMCQKKNEHVAAVEKTMQDCKTLTGLRKIPLRKSKSDNPNDKLNKPSYNR